MPKSLQAFGGVGVLAQLSKAKAICEVVMGRGGRLSRVPGSVAGPSSPEVGLSGMLRPARRQPFLPSRDSLVDHLFLLVLQFPLLP